MKEAYRRILHQARPVSARPRMELGNRAKLFMPFAALRGFDIAILTRERDRQLCPRVQLCQDQKDRFSRMLLCLVPGEVVTVTRFFPVKRLGGQELGEYVTETAAFLRLEGTILVLESGAVPLNDIRELIVSRADWGEPV